MIKSANKQASSKQSSWFKDYIWKDRAGFWATLGMVGSISICYASQLTLLPAIGATLLTGGVMWGGIKAAENYVIPLLKQVLKTVSSLTDTIHKVNKIVNAVKPEKVKSTIDHANLVIKAVKPKQIESILTKLNLLEDKMNKLIEAPVDELEQDPADLKHLLVDIKKQLKNLDGIQEKISNAIEDEREYEDEESRPYDIREVLDKAAEAVDGVRNATMIFSRQQVVQQQPQQQARKKRPKPKQKHK